MKQIPMISYNFFYLRFHLLRLTLYEFYGIESLPHYRNSVLEVPEFYVLFDIDKFDLIFAYFVLFHVNNFPSLVPT